MGPATLIALGILAVVASIVLNDVSRTRAATSRQRMRPEDEPLVPRNVNDPLVTGLQSQVNSMAGTIAGTVTGALGSGVAGGQVGAARGLGSQAPIPVDELVELSRRSYAAGAAGGGQVGRSGGASGGGIAGGAIGAAPFAFVENAMLSAAAGARSNFAVADRLGVPKFRITGIGFLGPLPYPILERDQ